MEFQTLFAKKKKKKSSVCLLLNLLIEGGKVKLIFMNRKKKNNTKSGSTNKEFLSFILAQTLNYHLCSLPFITLWANSADNKLMIFLLKKKLIIIDSAVSTEDGLEEPAGVS